MKVVTRKEVRLLALAIIVLAALFFCSSFSPLIARALPFGGPILTVTGCVDGSKYVTVGPPIGGAYVWTVATRTYLDGPPVHTGQWLLGLSGAPYACIVSVFPLVILPGIYIQMMGSSQ